jgi:hypothetical protein
VALVAVNRRDCPAHQIGGSPSRREEWYAVLLLKGAQDLVRSLQMSYDFR